MNFRRSICPFFSKGHAEIVLAGESGGRCDEGGPIVLADVISPVEQRMDDETEEMEDPMGFLNTNAYNVDLDMMSQPYG